MELTKQQMQYIDHRLENEGVKYWDIRIEMLDHVVSDVEQKLKPENSKYEFKEIVQESFENLGWKENFNGGGFESVLASRLRIYNKNKNKKFKQYFKETFFKPNFILGILSYATAVFYFQENKLALKVIFFSTIAVYVAFMLRFAFKYKVMNSARLGSAIVFATFPITIFNAVIYMPKVFLDYEISLFSISMIMIVVASFSAIGISYLNEELKKAQKIYNQLIS
ncbi:MAG: branched-subunit amino acid transport protein [Polaribacter sp.]|jgi:branched-subunit amino acid transport protein